MIYIVPLSFAKVLTWRQILHVERSFKEQPRFQLEPFKWTNKTSGMMNLTVMTAPTIVKDDHRVFDKHHNVVETLFNWIQTDSSFSYFPDFQAEIRCFLCNCLSC